MGNASLDTLGSHFDLTSKDVSMPNLIAYDICGVQPMTGPTGLIFAMRARFASMDGAEALADEANAWLMQMHLTKTQLVQSVVVMLVQQKLTLLY